MATKKDDKQMEVKGRGSKTVLEMLQAQPKMPVMLPVTENMEPQTVSINGCIYAIPRGTMVQVPQSVYNIIHESQMKSLKAKANIVVTQNNA